METNYPVLNNQLETENIHKWLVQSPEPSCPKVFHKL